MLKHTQGYDEYSMGDFPFEYVSLPPSTRRSTNATPSMTESILHNIAISTAEQEATDFVRSINSLQAEMARSTASRQLELQRQLQECHEAAKTRFAHFEHLTDIWRGAEFNLSQFLYRLDHGWREQVLRNAEWEEESRISMEQAAARQAHLMHSAQLLGAQQPLPTTIQGLIAAVDNEAQKQALGKLLLRNEANQIYLASYEANAVTRGRGSDIEGTFTVLGTIRNGSRDSYTVKWYRWTPTGHAFWCNCPDHKFNSARKNMVCKHICFLVTKVGRILDPIFFQNHRFSEEQQTTFRQVVGNAAIFADGLAALPTIASTASVHVGSSREARRTQFMEMRRPVVAEDSCPICYDEMGNGACLNCPTCSNNVHRECMEVWLERNKTCVFCRSDVWCAWA
jgi:hypothetical protein